MRLSIKSQSNYARWEEILYNNGCFGRDVSRRGSILYQVHREVSSVSQPVLCNGSYVCIPRLSIVYLLLRRWHHRPSARKRTMASGVHSGYCGEHQSTSTSFIIISDLHLAGLPKQCTVRSNRRNARQTLPNEQNLFNSRRTHRRTPFCPASIWVEIWHVNK